ncbi:MAG: hypothetical protein GKR91_08485 [Pseudomonadales bacterium]|nr:hypothetical protein [Pseudomonadales bacterium]
MSPILLLILIALTVTFLFVPLYRARIHASANHQRPEFDYHVLRTLVGLIALSIAAFSVLATQPGITIDSISAAYHTDGHDLFVGQLLIVSAFLLAYQGHEREGPNPAKGSKTEFVSAKVGSICVALTALLPTSDCPLGDAQICASNVPQYFNMSIVQTGVWHTRFAAVFFIVLAVILGIFVWRAWLINTNWSKVRAIAYSIFMLGMLYAVVIFLFFATERRVFYAEAIALVSFGFGWILAGTHEWLGEKAEALKNSNMFRKQTS